MATYNAKWHTRKVGPDLLTVYLIPQVYYYSGEGGENIQDFCTLLNQSSPGVGTHASKVGDIRIGGTGSCCTCHWLSKL